jgi:hypothetical protein
LKVAVTVALPRDETMQLELVCTLGHPIHPAKMLPGAAVGVRKTDCCPKKLEKHVPLV